MLTRRRLGKWPHSHHESNRDWFSDILQDADNNPQHLHPVLKEFQHLIETTPRLFMLFESMFRDVPNKGRYTHQINGKPQIRDYEHMLKVLNRIIGTAPTYSERENRMNFVGVPINTILNWPIGTHSGFAAFIDPDVNAMIRKVLDVWSGFLQSPQSGYVLGNSSTDWFGPTGLHDLQVVGNIGQTNHSFEELFVCDPTAPHRGYKSWDDYFTRLFRPGIRPVAAPGNDSVIVNSCESKTYNVQRNVEGRDLFWVKDEPYSVLDMLGGDPMADQFIGGTIYQAFLSALSYHRWHAPVSGRIVKAYTINGTYYSEPLYIDLVNERNHSYYNGHNLYGGQNIIAAQSYLTSMATRAVIFIEADNPAIGTMAFIGVGMAEVSTCDITVKEGDRVTKGDQIGMFHYGGSTHCLLFRDGVNVTGFPEKGQDYNVPVRGQLAVVQ
jgi:phosphatidylserine decarboxylase